MRKQNWTYAEIATQLEVPYETVRLWLNEQSREKQKKAMRKYRRSKKGKLAVKRTYNKMRVKTLAFLG